MKIKLDWYLLTIIAVGVLISVFSYPYLPDEIPTHWGVDNQPDDYSSKLTGVLIMPGVSILLYALFFALPHIDPQRDNYKKFKGSYDLIIRATITFMLLLHIATIAYSLGYPINIGLVVPIAVGLLFTLIGNYMPRFKHNYFIGVRTPWTLANSDVWQKTHRLSAKLFFAGGILMMLSAFLPEPWQFITFITVAIAVSLGSMVASYVFYRKIGKPQM
ncbi:SdpI family protein [Bacillus marinisedimentorum]|uniref:SdpI family protein n=1 Tax=Bacillus marinisedimentorum TaxID=1821260 RepID=UPI0009F6EA60|nr:SdpI family protein [Bacillus marinisedimentorum]